MEQVVFGGRMNIPKGTTFFKTGENVEHVYLLVNGQVRAKSEYMKMNLDNGALLGILVFLNKAIQKNIFLIMRPLRI